MTETQAIDWYFDFVSPFAYIALHRLDELATSRPICPRPILLAAVLDHHGQLGPAEIPPKRRWTYRMAHWQAQQAGLGLRFPAAHPFNPLAYLRLAIADGCRWEGIRAIFQRLWETGDDPASDDVFARLASRLSLDADAINDAEVKQALRGNTDAAIAAGVFGVPTLVIDGELFWGADAMTFASAYLADPGLIAQAEVERLDALPSGVRRPR